MITVQKLIILMIFVFITSCDNENNIIQVDDVIVEYLHLGHTRGDENPYMDPIVEKINFANYEMLWLGGDLAYLTSLDEKTITHVDSIYNLGDPNTLLALGNHDYSDLTRIANYTKRPPYYSYNRNGVTIVILDTQDSLSNIVGDQINFFNSVIDTLNSTTHLIILTHKLIWLYGDQHLESKIDSLANGYFGDCFYCVNPNNFYSDIYPKLQQIKKQGIEVICVAGDIGHKVKEFDYENNDGIYFLASGIHAEVGNNKGLVFTHNKTNKTIDWEFKILSDL